MKPEKVPLLYKDYYYKLRYKCSFKALAKQTIKPYMSILEAGCGKKSVINECNLKAQKCVGLDLKVNDLKQNECLDFKILGNLENLPFKTERFDLIICRNVVEHLQRPQKVFEEFERVLKTQGKLLVRTPNIYNPMMVLSAILPLNMRTLLKRKIFHDTEGDTYPTYYRCNSRRRLVKALAKASLDPNFIAFDGLMAYFAFSRLILTLVVLFEKITDIRFLRWLKMWIIMCFTRDR